MADFERKLYEAMASSDANGFGQLLESAQKARFPSSASQLVMKLLFEPEQLPPAARAAARISEIRIDSALYLALASRSNALKVDKDRVRAIVLPYIGGNHKFEYESKALATLAHLQKPSDVATIVQVAESTDSNRYRSAIMSLHVMCMESAKKALVNLEAKASQEKKRFLSEIQKFGSICP